MGIGALGMRGRRWAPALAMGVVLVPMGCHSDERTPRHPVRGQVHLGGEPASGAFVVFHPAVGGEALGPDAGRPSALVKPDGSFALTTYDEADGAPAGDYAVTVEWRKLVRKGGDAQAGPNVVPESYARAETTPLKVSVSEGDNELAPFQIEAKAGRRR